MKRVLVLGGTEFMGRDLVRSLIEAQTYHVSILNRGNAYWDEKFPYEEKVTRIKADRNEVDVFQAVLKNSLQAGNWDFVVDYSAYDEHDMGSSVEALKGHVSHYIYISTDSVYAVSKQPSHSGPRVEEDAVRPESADERKLLRKKDKYGDGKLRAEEVLDKAWSDYKFPFTALRLPDVYGPYDSSKRHWKYQMWLRGSEKTPVHMASETKSRKLSFVLSEDVTSAIFTLFALSGPALFGRAFNIAHDEIPTLEEYLKLTASLIQVEPHFQEVSSQSDDCEEFLPSVEFGAISNERAKKELQWKPTSLLEGLKKTVGFFEEAWKKYPNMRPKLDFLPQQTRQEVVSFYEKQ